MKLIFGIIVIYLLISPFMDSNLLPGWWNNPHGAILGLNQARLFQSESKTKPDLSKIKETLYMPIEAKANGAQYKGLLSVKLNPAGGIILGGAVFQGTNTDALGILDGELIDKGHYYEVKYKSQNASKLFNAQRRYQQKTEFPITLEIRAKGSDAVPYLIGPLKPKHKETVHMLPLHVDIEKSFIGKWRAGTYEGTWNFEFSGLPNSQLSGIANWKSNDKNCAYPLLGLPIGRKHMLFISGEHAGNPAGCVDPTWITYVDSETALEFNSFGDSGDRLTVTKE